MQTDVLVYPRGDASGPIHLRGLPKMNPDVRRKVRELVESVVADREDARVVRHVLRTMVVTAVNDFERYFDVRHAANRVAEHDFWLARLKAAKDQKHESCS